MEKIKFNTRSEKILVTAGCSHTQGSAFIKSNYFNPKTGLKGYFGGGGGGPAPAPAASAPEIKKEKSYMN